MQWPEYTGLGLNGNHLPVLASMRPFLPSCSEILANYISVLYLMDFKHQCPMLICSMPIIFIVLLLPWKLFYNSVFQSFNRFWGASQLVGHYSQSAYKQMVSGSYFRMDVRLSPSFCVVWIYPILFCKVLWCWDVASEEPKLCISKNSSVSEVICDCYRHCICIWDSGVSIQTWNLKL